ncbi:hypothetical protein FE257_000779 [Aspergillus nanangensis]|uniref:Phytanoyl-CoA dioxygenase n=1 Tax=Aspergillus nanangensis TaxID=2582783 RepID=A0AAD4CFV2_ASPNN|nr:hypothetical protein FE257_000779 [Aspergillus nanangensis]
MTSTKTATTPGSNRLQLTGKESPFGDWRDDLVRDGYAVIKNAIPRQRADGYADEMYSWLEGFGLGFDRHDLKTAHNNHLPIINEKGMCWWYSLAHEDFVWQMRAEPGVVGAFETVYDTKDLIVSFDALNFTFPQRTDLAPNSPWPHQDQNPDTQGFRCLQGLVNLLPNGPNDGGLIVCKGGHLLSEQFHAEMKHEARIKGFFHEWYGYTDAGMKWLADHGLHWEKIIADPGDLIVWDSRTPHYNLPSTSDKPRFCIYTCYMPVADVSQEDLKRKKEAFETFRTTSHWPNANFLGGRDATRDGNPCPYNRHEPVKKPQLDERGYKLTGIPYIQ